MSLYWSESEKKAFIKCLQNKDFASFESLSCFYRLSFEDLSPKKAKKLIDKIYLDFDENNLDVQEKVYLLLDKIIDGVCKNMYSLQRTSLRFYSVNQINDEVIKAFKAIDEDSTHSILNELCNFLIISINDSVDYDKCYQYLKELYSKYKDGALTFNDSIDFYNEILNKQQDFYIKQNKLSLIKNLCKDLPYTDRKEKSRMMSVKLAKFDLVLQKKDYISLGTTEEELRDTVEQFSSYLINLKTLKKEGINLTIEQINQMNNCFLEGKLDREQVREKCPNVSETGVNIIFDKYNQLKFPFLENIQVLSTEIPNQDLGYNYNNYKIIYHERYFENLALLFSNIKEKDVNDILLSLDKNPKLAILVFFINYFKPLNEKVVISILKNYYRIANKFDADSKSEDFCLPFDKLLSLSEAYDNANDDALLILGEELIHKIIRVDGFISSDPTKYIDMYFKMLKRDKCAIPLVDGEFGDLYYEMANDSDTERLMIGKNCFGSCIGIGAGGADAYCQALTEQNADVILFKDKNTNDFIARSLCFRKGNYLVFAPIYGEINLEESLYDVSLWNEISSKILKKAKDNNDCLEYIFLKYGYGLLDEEFPIIQDWRLDEYFPHADLEDGKCYLIGNSNVNKFLYLDPSNLSSVLYDTKRKRIKTKDDITNDELNRIRMIELKMTEDSQNREDQIFQYDNINNYDEVFLGQDYCICLKDGKIISKIILPTNCERQRKELDSLYMLLLENGYIKNIEDIFDESYITSIRR